MEFISIILILGLIIIDIIMVERDISEGKIWEFWIMLFLINSVLFSMLVLGNDARFIFKWGFISLAFLTFTELLGTMFNKAEKSSIGGADIFFIISMSMIVGHYFLYMLLGAYFTQILLWLIGFKGAKECRFIPILSVWAGFLAIFLLL